jgi:hypothetical protein
LKEKQGKIVMLICVGVGIAVLLIGQDSFHKSINACHNVMAPCFQESANIGLVSIFGAIFALASIPFTMLLTNTSQKEST